jgi:hypothetical protein
MVAGFKPACQNTKLDAVSKDFTFCGAKRTPFFSDLLPWKPRGDPFKLLNKDTCVYISFQFQKGVASNFSFVELDCSVNSGFLFEVPK